MSEAKRQYIKYFCKAPKKLKIQIAIMKNLKENLITEYLSLESKKTKIFFKDEQLQGIEIVVSRQREINFEIAEYNMIIIQLQEKLNKLKNS